MENFENWERSVFANNFSPEAGTLLFANPSLSDPHFKRSVVLLTEHSEDGTVGFVLNKPLHVPLSQLTNEFSDFSPPLFFGGPVRLDTIHFIHTLGDVLPDSKQILTDVYWGGNIETLKELAERRAAPSDAFRFYIGYAGWATGQLEDELKENAWITLTSDDAPFWNAEPDGMWRTLLRAKGGAYAVLANFPDDPKMN